MTGRKPLLEVTPEIQDALCALIEDGMPIRYACAEVGVSEPAFHRWISDGEKAEGAQCYKDFREAITRARGAKVKRLVRHIEDAGKIPSEVTGQVDWKAAAWLLERTEPEFTNKQKTEITGKDGGPVQIDTMTELLARARDAAKK